MVHRLHHERIYRGSDVMEKLANASICVCGVGALGSNLVVNLARIGFGKFTLIDRDRVEEQNIGTQVYSLDDVGGQKAEILRNMVYRELGLDAQAHCQDLQDRNVAKLLQGQQLVVDTFDNSYSRRLLTEYCRDNNINCLHAGVNNEYGEVTWNDIYKVPSEVGEDVCDYPLTRNLIMLVTSVASEALIRFIVSGKKENYSITMGDLSINRETGT